MDSSPIYLRLRSEAGSQASALEEVRLLLQQAREPAPVWLHCADRVLPMPELRAIQELIARAGLELQRVQAERPLALVPAAALGLEGVLAQDSFSNNGPAAEDSLTIHQGTLRSGDHLEVEGSLLVLGDVNPGARVSAGGDVRVWGRLRGVAHAGNRGNSNARIAALQLRPLQLRIADAVARGPEEAPPPGFCEQAVLRAGAIAIEPAEAQWSNGNWP
jgi:septum site-determining protein MinC